MKCKRLLLMLLVALMAPWAAMGQNTLTVCDGTNNSEYVPFEGYNADAAQHNQMIFPATDLTAMNGKVITQMVFYIDQSASNGSYTSASRLGTWTVSLGETTATTLSGLDNTTTLTQVYQGYFDCSSGTLTLPFTDGYTYHGGNLLVDLNHAAARWNRWYFLGVNQSGVTAITRGSNYQFLPKTTFTYETPATCPKPTGLVASNITNNEAKLSWTENGTATSWQLCINGDEDHPTTINTNPYTMTGLTPLTAYTAKVRAIGNDEYSAWSNEVSFSTTAEAEAVGDAWSDDFEGTSCGWELINGTVTQANWFWGTAENSGSGSHSIYTTNDNGNTCSYNTSGAARVYASKLLTFADGKYTFQFDWKCNGETTSYDYLSVGLLPATAVITADNTNSGTLPTGWISVHDATYLNGVTAWQTSPEKTVQLESGNYYLVLRWRQDGSGGTGKGAAVDNVSITKVACDQDVTDLAVSEITTSSATLSWNGGEATQWQVAYSTASNFEGATEEIVSTASYNMSSLQSSSTYYVKVRAYCGGEDFGLWCQAISFATACDVITDFPWSENFDSYTAAAGVLPICWNKINTTTYSSYQGYPRIYNYTYQSSPNCLYFYSYYSSYYDYYDPQDQYAILPEMSSLAGKEVVLYARGYNTSSTFKIGTMSDPDDASTFNLINEQTGLTTSYQKFSYIIPADRTDSYLAIMIDAATSSRTTNGVYIDDITIKEYVAVTADQIVETVSDPATEMTWSQFAEHVNNGDHFSSTTFTLMEDITITEMVGTEENPFTGIFEGNNKTITADITSGEKAAAPFHYIKDATIRNLTMTGTVTETATTSDGYHAGGLVGYAWSGYNIIENCRVSTNVTIAGYGGGIVGHGKTSVVFLKGCVYDGTITNALNVDGNNKGVGGLVGWFDGGAALNIHDSYYNGTYTENESVSVYFHPVACKTGGASVTVNIYDCYYTCDNPAADSDGTNNVVTAGKKAYMVTGAEGITVDLPAATIHYSCSGISGDDNATWNGIKIGDDIYGGEGVTLALSLSGANGYEADHGTLTPISTTYTLLMEAYNTTISGVDCPVPYNVAVPAATLAARSAQVTWMGGSDSYTVEYGEVVDVPTTYDFEDQTIPTIFTNSETHAWTVTSDDKHEGTFSIKSGGAGTAYATSDLTLTLTLTDNAPISFWYKASSEANYDYGRFLIDGSQKFQTSGTSNEWTQYTGELTAGTHTLIWRYYKDSGTDSGDDCFYVDDITITSSAVETWTTLSNIPASPYTIENLNPETTYQVKVSGICAGDETDYSDMVSFTTPASCIVPTGLAVSNVTTNSAYASWTAGGSETQYVVAYKKATDADWTVVENRVDQTSYTLSNLDAATDYEVKVQAYCDADEQSDWTEVVSFTTECDVITVDLTHPFTEGFEGTTFPPTCWETIPTTYEDYYNETQNADWARSTSYSHTSAYSGYYGPIYLVMPDIQISNEVDGAQLSFWSYNTYASSYDKNSVVLLNGENETELWSPESVSQSWVETTIDLTDYIGQTISLAFKYEGDDAHGWYIDDVEIIALQTITKNITGYGTSAKGGYYLIASPVVENVTPAANNGFIAETAANYDLYYFNQAAPVDAETGIRLEWINFKETAANGGNFSIENGKGYLYASKEGTTLRFTGTPYSGNGQVTLATTAGVEWAGWNLVGNPFAQTAYADRAYYALQNGSELTPTSATTGIGAMEGIFVVAENAEDVSMTFSTTAPNSKAANLAMNVIKERNVVDRAIVSFSQGSQLRKFQLNPNHTKVFMPVEGKDYAITSVEGQVGEVPVSFKAEENGTYTLSFTSEEVSFSYLHLIDNMTGNDVNLLETPSYTFDARTTDYASRFKLVFAVGSSANDETFGFVNASGNFCIFGIEGEATVQVIDVLGHMLSSETFSGSYEKRINGAPGVYMVRLIQGNDVKVQKVVVR